MVLDNTGRGGSQTYVMNVLRHIDKEQYYVDVAVNRNPQNGYGDEIISNGSRILFIPKFKIFNWLTYTRAWKKILDTNHYDIIHGHVSSTAAIYLSIAKQYGCATIAHSHSAGYRGNWITRQIKKIFTIPVKKYADYWLACSEKAATRLFGNKYKDYPNYKEIPNSIDVKKYCFDNDIRINIRTQLGIDDSTLLLGHIGSFSTPKNHTFLLDVFKDITKKLTNIKFILIGDGPLEGDIKRKSEYLNISKLITYTGNVNNVNEYMMAMDGMIFPSKFEGFPITIIEAQSSGLYTIMSDTITNQVILTDIIKPVPLNAPPSYWADQIISKENVDRISINDIVANSVFNITKSIHIIEGVYHQIHAKYTQS